MSLDRAAVAHIARLARLHVAEEDLDRLAGELSHIIGWVEQLSEVDTGDTAPMSSVVEMALKTRDDLVTDGGVPEKVLANAPEATEGYYVVSKVVE